MTIHYHHREGYLNLMTGNYVPQPLNVIPLDNMTRIRAALAKIHACTKTTVINTVDRLIKDFVSEIAHAEDAIETHLQATGQRDPRGFPVYLERICVDVEGWDPEILDDFVLALNSEWRTLVFGVRDGVFGKIENGGWINPISTVELVDGKPVGTAVA